MDWRMDPRIPEDLSNLDPRIPGNLRRMFPHLFSQPPPGLGVTNPTTVSEAERIFRLFSQPLPRPIPPPVTNANPVSALERAYLLEGTNFHPDPAFNYLLQTAQWQSFNISNRMGVVLRAFFETLRNMVMGRRAERAAFRRRLDLRARRSTEKRKFSWFRQMR